MATPYAMPGAPELADRLGEVRVDEGSGGAHARRTT